MFRLVGSRRTDPGGIRSAFGNIRMHWCDFPNSPSPSGQSLDRHLDRGAGHLPAPIEVAVPWTPAPRFALDVDQGGHQSAMLLGDSQEFTAVDAAVDALLPVQRGLAFLGQRRQNTLDSAAGHEPEWRIASEVRRVCHLGLITGAGPSSKVSWDTCWISFSSSSKTDKEAP